jgi:hypothetical protein
MFSINSFFNFTNPVSTTPGTIIVANPKMKMPLFTNNSQVYYKPASLSAGGVGTVRNTNIKSRKI